MINELKERRKFLLSLLKRTRGREKSYPAGTLRISRSHGYVQYYHRAEGDNTIGKYLGRNNIKTARLLAQKNYEQKVAAAAREELEAIEAYINQYPQIVPEDVYDKLRDERRKLVTPFPETAEMLAERWSAREYEGLGFAEDYPEFLTDRGERVRSKSEVLIANQLENGKIPYKYECPLTLEGFGTVYPDFTALNIKQSREMYWEHLGMMDNPEYVEKAVRKISAYIQNGILPGDQLIITAETKTCPLNTRQIRMFIDRFLR